MPVDRPLATLAALTQRLSEAARVLKPAGLATLSGVASTVDAAPAALLLPVLADTVIWALQADDPAPLWLFLTVVYGRYPSEAEFLRHSRAAELVARDQWLGDLLESARQAWGGLVAHEMRVVTDPVVVLPEVGMPDVSSPDEAQHDGQAGEPQIAGISRLTHELVVYWEAGHPFTKVEWDSGFGDAFCTVADDFLIVPHRTTVILPDVPTTPNQVEALRSLARFSGNTVSVIGQGEFALLHPEVSTAEAVISSAAFFSVVKYCDRVAAISEVAAGEYAGLISALPTQGLVGPIVRSMPLPSLGSAWTSYAADVWAFLVDGDLAVGEEPAS